MSPPTAPPGLPRRPARNRRWLAAVAAVAALLLVAGGAFLWFRSTATSDEEVMADRFRNARPAGFIPSLPSLSTGSLGLPEGAGDAQAFMAQFEPVVRQANSDLVAAQEVLFDWADGDTDVAAARTSLEGLLRQFDQITQAAVRAPESLSRGASKLSDAAISYNIAINSLLDWMDSRNAGAKTTFSFTIGEANVAWDEGVIALYRSAGLPQPALPHPQVTD